MNHQITLLLGVHAHQPVGNFPEVIEDAHQRCYKPFLETLYAYPEFRFAAHFSGWLLDWLRERHPDDMERLATMVRRGQVELFSSGDTEPVLAAIPHRDRVGQLNVLNDKLTAWTGQQPRGAWLTERVWESSVVTALAESGIAYVTVDDYHFLCTGKAASELDGYFSTEEDGVRLDLFPISEALRYRLPFSPASDVIAYLEELAAAGRRVAVYFDDIEKFGIWPETHDWVYGRGWLRVMIEGVLASPTITTATYGDFHARNPSRGIVYLPTVSYSEMNEWTLPMPAAGTYAELLANEEAADRSERSRPFLRGGIWRNFLSRYPEANWQHKRMLGLSARLAELPTPSPALTACLYRAQANDAYWHGLFGGLYLPHLRRAVWNNLVELEAGLDALGFDTPTRPTVQRLDLDLDGYDEIFVHNPELQVVVRDDGLAAACELSSYPLRHNFADSLRRYHEHYHDRIGCTPSKHQGDGIASAHDIVRFKHPVEAADIVPDTLPRALCLDRLDGVAVTDYRMAKPTAETLAAHFIRDGIAKRYAIDAGTLTVDWEMTGLTGRCFETELNLAMPSCDGFLGRYVLADGSIGGGFGQPLQQAETESLTLEDGVLDGRLAIRTNQIVALECRPHQTVSQSEAGFEKIMQSVELRLRWIIPDDACTLRLQLSINPITS
jgi:alpha-amylase